MIVNPTYLLTVRTNEHETQGVIELDTCTRKRTNECALGKQNFRVRVVELHGEAKLLNMHAKPQN